MNAFEAEMRRRLDEVASCCTLSGVTLYRPDRFGNGSLFGFEIDNLLHWQNGTDDRLVIFECKDSPIEVASTRETIAPENQEWYSFTPGGKKNLKDQLFNQAESIWQNLCVPPTQRRRIDAFVVSSYIQTPQLRCVMFTEQGLTMHLISAAGLMELLEQPSKLAATLDAGREGRFLRVAQSELLRLARQSVVVPELGHPEIDQAMELVRRCRQTLDGRLFDFFAPRDRRWAINGSAGMGKSVLLAYAITVFSSGKTLRDVPREKNDRTPMRTELVDHVDERLRLPPVPNRRILVIGLKPRQLEVLNGQWEQFRSRFMQLASNYLSDVKPSFKRLHHTLQLDDYNVVCVDEAHDLSVEDQKRIAEWWNKDPSRYLIIACDHHQKLRLAGADHEKWMLNGISFAGCATRLKRNYRSPTPVYCAALGLMFRWFAPAGPKVVPTRAELEDGFGFHVGTLERRKGGVVDLTMRNDAHPANHWRYTVSRFTTSDAAFAWLSSNNLSQGDVLWVRFGEQDLNAERDAEDIKKVYNYKDLNSLDSHHTIDAEIKGREFPIVVIEGFPKAAAAAECGSEVWALRRQLYLCASRATAFLFFIFNGANATPACSAIVAELDAMLAALSSPIDPNAASNKTWTFMFDLPESPVNMDVFLDEEFDNQPDQPGIPAPDGDTNRNDSTTTPVLTQTVAENTALSVDTGAARPAPQVEKEIVAGPEAIDSGPSPAEPAIEIREVAHGAQIVVPARPKNNTIPPAGVQLHRHIPRRVHEIAKVIGWDPKALLLHINNQNPKLQIKSVSWTVDWMTAEAMIKELTGTSPPAVKQSVPDDGLPTPSSTPTDINSSPSNSPADQGALDATKTDLLSEKDFQRIYGQVPGWKKIYRDEYLKSGLIPAYLQSLVKPPSPRTKIVPASTPTKPVNAYQPAPLLTVRQIGQYLGLKPFQVIAALMPIKPDANPDDILDRKHAERVCERYQRPYPTRDQVSQLLSIPAPPKK